MKNRIAPEEHFSSSDTLDTLSSMGTESSASEDNSPLRMEEIMGGNFLDPENLVESEEDSSVDDGYVFEGQGMIFPGLDGTIEDSIISPYGGYEARARGMSEESTVSIAPPFDTEALQRSPTSTAVSMSPPDNNTHLSNYTECKPTNNETQPEYSLELIQSIINTPLEPLQIDPNAPSLRDLIYGRNHVFENEVINLANLFESNI